MGRPMPINVQQIEIQIYRKINYSTQNNTQSFSLIYLHEDMYYFH